MVRQRGPVRQGSIGCEQIAYLLWTLFYHGLLTRICAWAKTWPQIAIAKRLLEGLRLLGGADPGFAVGQLRFVT